LGVTKNAAVFFDVKKAALPRGDDLFLGLRQDRFTARAVKGGCNFPGKEIEESVFRAGRIPAKINP